MSFRKRNTAIARTDTSTPRPPAPPTSNNPTSPPPHHEPAPSASPSNPTTSTTTTTTTPPRPTQTTSTGSRPLDALLSRPPGLPLHTSLLLLEQSATDFSGALCRISAAEGIARGETLHVVGLDQSWTRTLPAVVAERTRTSKTHTPSPGRDVEGPGREGAPARAREMKIAWRYEAFGNRNASTAAATSPHAQAHGHTFDLTKRLELPAGAQVHYHALGGTASPFDAPLASLHAALAAHPAQTHRILVPGLLSPALYPPHAADPAAVLAFLHALRGLLHCRAYAASATLSLSLALHARSSALVRWAEHLCDAVVELAPFPHRLGAARAFTPSSSSAAGGSAGGDEEPQGLLRIHKVAAHARCVPGEPLLGEDWAFALSRRRFAVVRYTLPVDDETDDQAGGQDMPKKADLEF